MLPDLSELNLSRFEGDPAVTYAVDSRLRLQYCNAAWDAFAIANGGDSLLRPSPIGCDLLAVVPWDLKEFYTNAFETVWRMGVPWEHQYECRARKCSVSSICEWHRCCPAGLTRRLSSSTLCRLNISILNAVACPNSKNIEMPTTL